MRLCSVNQEREREAKKKKKINVNKHCAVGLAATLRSVGWDYLCDWISEEGLPKGPAKHSLLSTVAGVCLCRGGAVRT